MSLDKIYERQTDVPPSELPILTYPNELLHKEAENIIRFDDEDNHHLTQLFADMSLTMINNRGIGLAAPQVGILANMLVILAQQEGKHMPEPYALINPIIKEQDGEYEWEEGCLSVPGYYENRTRAKKVVIQFQNLVGEEKEVEFHGLYAFVVQHEMDHLDGKLFIDGLSSFKKKFSVEKKVKKYLKQSQS